MKSFGIEIINNNYKQYIIKNDEYNAQNYVIEGDWSGASYFYAIKKLVSNQININNVNANSVQGDANLINILDNFGVENNIDMEQMPDTAMTIMVLAAIFSKKTIITGLSTLKDKECDRIEIPKRELEKFGIKCKTTLNSIEIIGQTFNDQEIIEIETYHDHRIAMAFSILAIQRKILIKDADVVNKSFPNYWEELAKIINVQKIIQ
jgi:3-phosphoshikimate 1-carboxyvinyltransferase